MPKISLMKISGIVIAGGKSLRMGTDKSSLIYRNQSFLERTAGLLQHFTGDIIVSANNQIDKTYKIIPDSVQNTGPIGGLYTCLPLIKNDRALVIPVDMPLLNIEVLQYLLQQADFNKKISVFKAGGRLQMLTGLYHKEIVPLLQKQMNTGDYKLRNLLKKIPHQIIDAGKFSPKFVNVNTPDELKKLNLKHG